MPKPGGNGKKQQDIKPENFTIVPDKNSDYNTAYSNFAAVSRTPEDINIDFCQLTQPYTIDANNKTISAPIVGKIIIPANMAEGLVKALNQQIAKYKKDSEKR
ncbi:MAG: DUF3467 domain-containing protein [Candidatus Dadabacteria bacterium]|nr:DUF3467 domain-containing protein [Candidatus Dadabacteria bacterium]